MVGHRAFCFRAQYPQLCQFVVFVATACRAFSDDTVVQHLELVAGRLQVKRRVGLRMQQGSDLVQQGLCFRGG